jgi:hypothetical protein
VQVKKILLAGVAAMTIAATAAHAQSNYSKDTGRPDDCTLGLAKPGLPRCPRRTKAEQERVELSMRAKAKSDLDQTFNQALNRRSAVEAARRVAAKWDADEIACRKTASNYMDHMYCSDQGLYGVQVMMAWLDANQLEGEAIYGVSNCAKGFGCQPTVIIPPDPQGDYKEYAKKFTSQLPIPGAVGTTFRLMVRAKPGAPWVALQSYRG